MPVELLPGRERLSLTGKDNQMVWQAGAAGCRIRAAGVSLVRSLLFKSFCLGVS